MVSIAWRCQFPFSDPHPATRGKLAARLGVEPRQTDSESVVLPLHHRAVKPFRSVTRRGTSPVVVRPKRRRAAFVPPPWIEAGRSAEERGRMEPAMGLEPATPCLQNRCSAIELRRRVPPTVRKGSANNNCAATNPGSWSRGWWLPGDSNPEPTD